MKITLDEINWIITNDFKIHPKFPKEISTEELLQNLGSNDTNLREKSLDILDTWIMRGVYSSEELIELAHTTKENLLSGLEEINTDSVFLRSFSALILGSIIHFDEQCALGNIGNRKPFLSENLLMEFFKTSLEYYRKERDVRGYIDTKEWAHSIAHGADLFKYFAQHRLIGKEELLQILEIFKLKLGEPQEDIYKAREELRISVAIYTVFLRRILDTNEIKAWFQSFAKFFEGKKWFHLVKEPFILNIQLNLRSFFNYMYFLVKNGIANTGFYASPFYKDNLLKNRKEICAVIEKLILQMDSSHYFIPESI